MKECYLGDLILLECIVEMQLGLEVFAREQHGRFDRDGGDVTVPGPDVLVGKAEDDAEEPKVAKELEQTRLILAGRLGRNAFE